jgi:hypothetical protein
MSEYVLIILAANAGRPAGGTTRSDPVFRYKNLTVSFTLDDTTSTKERLFCIYRYFRIDSL